MKQKKENFFVYFDPPYIKKGPELYKNHFSYKEHEYLSKNIRDKLFEKNWIVTYDKSELVYNLYEDFCITDFNLNYSAGNNKVGNELMIFSNKLVIKNSINI